MWTLQHVILPSPSHSPGHTAPALHQKTHSSPDSINGQTAVLLWSGQTHKSHGFVLIFPHALTSPSYLSEADPSNSHWRRHKSNYGFLTLVSQAWRAEAKFLSPTSLTLQEDAEIIKDAPLTNGPLSCWNIKDHCMWTKWEFHSNTTCWCNGFQTSYIFVHYVSAGRKFDQITKCSKSGPPAQRLPSYELCLFVRLHKN